MRAGGSDEQGPFGMELSSDITEVRLGAALGRWAWCVPQRCVQAQRLFSGEVLAHLLQV